MLCRKILVLDLAMHTSALGSMQRKFKATLLKSSSGFRIECAFPTRTSLLCVLTASVCDPSSPAASLALLLTLEIIQQHTPLLALLTPVPHDHTRAIDHLPRISLSVQNTQTRPLTQLLAVRHFDQRDLVLRAQRNDEFLVRLFFAGFVEDAHVCLATVEGFGGFAEAAREAVVNEGDFEDSCGRMLVFWSFISDNTGTVRAM